jgi:hypothetical protein
MEKQYIMYSSGLALIAFIVLCITTIVTMASMAAFGVRLVLPITFVLVITTVVVPSRIDYLANKKRKGRDSSFGSHS